MTQEFSDKEIAKIMNDDSFKFPLNVAMASAWILGNLKGINLKVMDVSKVSSMSDYFVLATATNTTQAKSMASSIVEKLKKHKIRNYSLEGADEANWILIDFGDVIVHVFTESFRGSYDLDGLWKEATMVQVPNSYYYSIESDQETESDSTSNYF